ncbi:MAG: hypothetical protein AVDCRST_MAG32-2748 [uncultured Nocardioides sp.]|uniref:DUF2975 domain-containing protein n=1 Tax=uncultured Nocardioides sp. TaxID=198441 RepID=A0A6J4NT69_9ACTN|nr:MAG: hypothetical protein AVDCRST_MAG32-2748 [uncultured Nocardioides sp.]
MRTKTSEDPLKGLETMVGIVVAMMALLTAGVLAGLALGSGSVPGLDAEVCVTTSEGGQGFRRGDGETTGPVGLVDGITWRADEVTLCDPTPDGATRAWAAGGLVVWLGAPLLFFAMLWRMLRRARREGVFADAVPPALRSLGGGLLVWAALDVVVTGLVDGALLNRMTDGALVFTYEMPWLLVLLGMALLALSKVMELAVRMRHEVEATI